MVGFRMTMAGDGFFGTFARDVLNVDRLDAYCCIDPFSLRAFPDSSEVLRFAKNHLSHLPFAPLRLCVNLSVARSRKDALNVISDCRSPH